MHLKGPCGQLCLALWTSNPPPQPILIHRPLSGHSECVCLLQHATRGVARLENHAHRLAEVCLQAGTVKEVHKDVKGPLYPDRLNWCYQDAVGAEIIYQVLYWPPKALWDCLFLWYHRHPVVHDRMHDDIGEHGRYGVDLCNFTKPLEGRDMVTYRLCHHGEPSPVRPENPDCPGSHAAAFQDVQELVPVQGVISLLEVQ